MNAANQHSLFDRAHAYVWTPQPHARLRLLRRAFMLLFATDLFATHIGPAWRYGAASFSVAHFAWLDALPVLRASSYLALLSLTACLAVFAAFTKQHRAPTVIAFVLYTYMWSSSMLDSYQHHYLLSWLLLLIAAFPQTADTEAHDRVPAPAFAAFCLLLGIVYAYSALTKTEDAWVTGDAIRNITRNGTTIPLAFSWSTRLGIETPFRWMGAAALLSEIVASIGYFALPILGHSRSASALRIATFLAAVSFHLFGEYLDLAIGWFGFYMLLLACVLLPPEGAWLKQIHAASRTPANAARAAVDLDLRTLGAVRFAVPVAALALAVYVGASTALPGMVWGFALGAPAVFACDSFHSRATPSLRALVALLFTVILATVSLARTRERFDFFRFRAGDEARRGETEEAIADYILTERFAPIEERGRRLDDIARLRAQLARR